MGTFYMVSLVVVCVLLGGYMLGDILHRIRRSQRERTRERLWQELDRYVEGAHRHAFLSAPILITPNTVYEPLPTEWTFYPENLFTSDFAYIRRSTQVWVVIKQPGKWRASLLHSDKRTPPVGRAHAHLQGEWNGVDLGISDEFVKSWQCGVMPSPIFADALEDRGVDSTHPFLFALRSVNTCPPADVGSAGSSSPVAGERSSSERNNSTNFDTAGGIDGNSSSGGSRPDAAGDSTSVDESQSPLLVSGINWWGHAETPLTEIPWEDSHGSGWTEFSIRQVSDDTSSSTGPDVPPTS